MPKIQNNDRQALQELYFHVVNCVAALKQIIHLANINATDNLRKIVMRMPDHLIHIKANFLLTSEKKVRTLPFHISPNSLGNVSKPNLVRSLETFRIPVPDRKMVF